MNRTKRLIIVAGVGTALAGGLAVPVAAWATAPTPAPSSSATPGTSPDGTERGPRGGHGGRGGRGAPGEMAAKLAETLGLDKDKVTAALDTLRQQRGAEAEAALAERLKAAVTAGTLTQAESDAVLKAYRAGLLPGGPGRH